MLYVQRNQDTSRGRDDKAAQLFVLTTNCISRTCVVCEVDCKCSRLVLVALFQNYLVYITSCY